MFVKLNYLNDSKISCFGIGLTANYDSLSPPPPQHFKLALFLS